MTDPLAPALDRVLRHAADLAGAWGSRARTSTTVARERAILRLFGVTGLDRADVPLASAVVERAMGEDPARLARRDRPALRRSRCSSTTSRRSASRSTLRTARSTSPSRRSCSPILSGAPPPRPRSAAWRRSAVERDRREPHGAPGDARRSWGSAAPVDRQRRWPRPTSTPHRTRRRGSSSPGPTSSACVCPAIRELVAPAPRPRDRRRTTGGRDRPDGQRVAENPAEVPTGSQRALAALRERVDEAAAEARRYVRLSSVASALAAPEQALVAALERIDVVEADPIAEIVGDGVDPDRALADHAFGHRLLRRAGTLVMVGPGPLIVAPDLATGVPADAATRAGRAFAMQALSVAFVLAERDPGGAAHRRRVDAMARRRSANPATQALATVALQRRGMAGDLAVVRGTGRSRPDRRALADAPRARPRDRGPVGDRRADARAGPSFRPPSRRPARRPRWRRSSPRRRTKRWPGRPWRRTHARSWPQRRPRSNGSTNVAGRRCWASPSAAQGDPASARPP